MTPGFPGGAAPCRARLPLRVIDIHLCNDGCQEFRSAQTSRSRSAAVLSLADVPSSAIGVAWPLGRDSRSKRCRCRTIQLLINRWASGMVVSELRGRLRRVVHS